MKILVTGANGFIGSALMEELGKSHTVFGIDNYASGLHDRGLGVLHLDISQSSEYAKLCDESFDTIYHCAASFANELSVDYPLIDFNTNAMGTMLVLEYAKRCKCTKFIYLGSSSSYGGDESSLPFVEDCKLQPGTPYAISKHIGEMYCQFYSNCFDVYIPRLFNVYGPGDYPGLYRNAIPNMAYRAWKKRKIPVYGMTSTRDFTYIDDVVYFLGLFMRDLIVPGIYNICTGKETKIEDVAKFLANNIEKTELSYHSVRSWDMVNRRVGKNDKILGACGFDYSFVDIAEGMELTLKWLKQKAFTESIVDAI